MKKTLVVLLTVILVFSLTFTAAFAQGKNVEAVGHQTEKADKAKGNEKNVFKNELNQQKKEIEQQKNLIEEQKTTLEAQYQESLSSGDTAGADGLLNQIRELDGKIGNLKGEMNTIKTQRQMIVKAQYTSEELSKFENASKLIENLYENANTLKMGSVVIKNNIIKFDTPPYIKGGRTVVPVRAITQGMGAEVTWNEETQSVEITKDDTIIVLKVGSNEALVNGEAVAMDTIAEITSERTYVPLRFIAQTFGLRVDWDSETETIEIEDDEEDTTEEETADEEEAVIEEEDTTEEETIDEEEAVIEEEDTTEEETVGEEEAVIEEEATTEEETIDEEEAVIEEEVTTEEETVDEEEVVTEEEAGAEEETTTDEQTTVEEEITTDDSMQGM